MHGNRSQGFLKADAAPITTAKTSPTPAPRDAPTAAAVREFALFCESRLAFAALSCSLANSSSSLSLASSWTKWTQIPSTFLVKHYNAHTEKEKATHKNKSRFWLCKDQSQVRLLKWGISGFYVHKKKAYKHTLKWSRLLIWWIPLSIGEF